MNLTFQRMFYLFILFIYISLALPLNRMTWAKRFGCAFTNFWQLFGSFLPVPPDRTCVTDLKEGPRLLLGVQERQLLQFGCLSTWCRCNGRMEYICCCWFSSNVSCLLFRNCFSSPLHELPPYRGGGVCVPSWSLAPWCLGQFTPAGVSRDNLVLGEGPD